MTSFTDMDEAIEAFLSGKHPGEVVDDVKDA
jgi:hypothetical protein